MLAPVMTPIGCVMLPVVLRCKIQVPVMSAHCDIVWQVASQVVPLGGSHCSPVSTMPLPQQGVIGVSTHAAVQVPLFCNTEFVQVLGAVQLVGQAPG